MLDLLTAAPKEIAFGDYRFKVGALKMKELGLLQRWIRDHAERPTVVAERMLRFADPADHRQIRKDAVMAEREWPPEIGTPEGNSVLFSDPDGQKHFLGVMLRKYQPDLADPVVDEVTQGLSMAGLSILVAIAFGTDDLDPEELSRLAKEAMAAAQSDAAEPLSENLPGSSSAIPGTSA